MIVCAVDGSKHQHRLAASDKLGRHVAGIAKRAQDNASRRQNTEPGNRSMIKRNA